MTTPAPPLPDRRRHPWRPDIAAAGLEGRVPSLRFSAGVPGQVRHGSTSLRTAPDDQAEQASQLLYGEAVTVYDQAEGWAWVQNHSDGYVGYVRAAALDPRVTAPSHRVRALGSFVLPRPELRAPARDRLSLGAPVTVTGEDNGYARLACGGWVFARDLAPLTETEPDLAATALRLLGVPYLWGGRTSLGLDCSALVQLALAAAGIAAPRDSDMQRTETGQPLPVSAEGAAGAGAGGDGGFRRGDLVFFPGHVGIMLDRDTLVHATAFVMAVTVEPLAAVIARTDPSRGGGLLAARRLGPAMAGGCGPAAESEPAAAASARIPKPPRRNL
jgi:cell wall-associated NlpC family hydrolase